ncbi:MAG: polysaccharide pyruvyl transferase family protein [Verrucomicrobiae bacterium]|nr:polysaccharide pyruvyl transferase family protein [Verrucomicrobiae bacterium]
MGAGFSTRNLGVWALASSAIAAVLNRYPKAQIQLLDYERQPASHSVKHPGGIATVELVNIRFSKKIWLPNSIVRLLLTAAFLRLMPFQRVRTRIIEANPWLKAVAQADLVGSIAGGDSFSDIYGLGRLLYVALPQVLVLLLARPLVLLPQTLGPFTSTPARAIARYILRRAAIVYARDCDSLDDIKPLLGQETSNCRPAYDMAFALEPVAPSASLFAALNELEHCRPLVGLNVSGLLCKGGYNGRNMFGLKHEYCDLIRHIIRDFVHQGAHVVLVPHVLGTAPNSESDVVASLMLHRQLTHECSGRLHLLNGDYDHQQIKHVIGKCDFFVGSRMHACIAALSQCVPAVGLAYSRKFRGVLGSIGVADLVIDLSDNDIQEVRKQVQDIYSRKHLVRTQLEQNIPGVKSSVLSLFSEATQNGMSYHAGASYP